MMHTGPFKALETLCGLDAMRTSKNLRIVQLAEELYGEESEEDFVRRRDAFDSVQRLLEGKSDTCTERAEDAPWQKAAFQNQAR
jgi:hypothetical protein